MSLVRDANAQPLVQFPVPVKGTWRGVAANMLAPDTLYDSLNVFLRKGKLRQRPGLSLLNSTIFDNPIIGGAMAVTPSSKVLLAIARDRLYRLNDTDTSWQLDTVTPFANNDNALIDITFLETASQYVAIIATEGQVLKRWILGSGVSTVVATTGTIPLASSVCTAARRIIALVPPHTLVWSSTLTYNDWPALAIAKVAQTNDTGICVRSLGTLDFVLYKERSIYVAKAQAGSDAAAFSIQFIQSVEGPAGIHAVVDVKGTHYYMTKNGRIGTFNGSNAVQWICDGLWFHLQDIIDPSYAYKIFAVYDYRLHTITFFYPVTGSNGLMQGMVTVNLPLEGSGINTVAPFLGVCNKPCSYGYEMRFNDTIDRSLIFTSTLNDCQSFLYDESVTTDDGDTYQCMMQTGLYPLPEMKSYHVSIESFFERSNGYGQVSVIPVTSDTLENEGGSYNVITEQIINLNVNPVREYIGFDAGTRFFGLRYTWLSDTTVKYGGSAVYGRILS